MASTQAPAEFAATLLHKISPAAHPEDVIALLEVLAPMPLVIPDGDMIRRAVEALLFAKALQNPGENELSSW